MAKVKDGFYKQHNGTIGDNSYLLLGRGDEINLSYFYWKGRNTNNLSGLFNDWNDILPINAFGFRHGYPYYTDPEFKTITSIAWYNANQGTGTCTRMTVANAIADNSSLTDPHNSSGYIFKIQPSGTLYPVETGSSILKIGGTSTFTPTAKKGAIWLQVFRAWLPVNAKLYITMNSTGNGRTWKWITNNTGTGKWAWYAAIHINGSIDGTYSTFGHLYAGLENATTSTKWYLSFIQFYELTNNEYDGYKTRYADNAINADDADTLDGFHAEDIGIEYIDCRKYN